MSVVLFTGAGASRPLGFPTTAEFFDQKASGVPYKPANEKIFVEMQKFLRIKILDVENALWLLDPLDSYIGSDSGRFFRQFMNGINSEDWPGRFSAMAKQMKERCFDLYGRLPSLSEVENLYLPLLQALRWDEQNVQLYTTNYDLSTDKILMLGDREKVPSSDGFDRLGWYSLGDYNKAKSRGIEVYRLHGSMSWVEQDGEIINKRTIEKSAQKHLFIAPGYKGNPKDESQPEPMINAHECFQKSLMTTPCVVVIGFSFRDTYVNSLFDNAFQKNHALHMVYINQSVPQSAESGFGSLREKYGDRIQHIEKRFGDPEIANIVSAFVISTRKR